MNRNGAEVTIAVVAEEQVSAGLDAEIRDFLIRAFPDDSTSFAQTRHWHGSAPAYSVLARLGSRLVAHAGAIVRDIRVGSRTVRIYGIQNMGVLPEVRGTGAGQRVLDAVAGEAVRRGVSFGLLFCIPALERYYRRDGWETRSVVVRMNYGGQDNIPIPGKNVCMARCLAAEPFPDGDIHLQGADW
jgi:GNAT superfamily N-acetyltransferase